MGFNTNGLRSDARQWSDTPCWEWEGRVAAVGYGRVKADGEWQYAHRVSYEVFIGPIPEGLVIDHLCRNTTCVNPLHLEPVEQGENVLRGNSPNAINARKTHCVRGHPFDKKNTYIRKDRGYRECRKCRQDAAEKSHRKAGRR